MSDLEKTALELCWEIEKLPASEQQTKCSVLASGLRNEISLAWKEMQCCDDIKLDQPLHYAVCELQKARELAQRDASRFRNALSKLADYPPDHKFWCAVGHGPDRKCDCGLGALLVELIGARAEASA